MKFAIKILIAITAICVFAGPVSAYTLTGTVSPGRPTAIHLQRPPNTGGGYLKLTITMPQAQSAGVGYSTQVCLGPRLTSCFPAPVVVPGGEHIVVFYTTVNWSNPLWLNQGTTAAVPYTIDVDYVP